MYLILDTFLIEAELNGHILPLFGKVVVEDGLLRSIAQRQLSIDNNRSDKSRLRYVNKISIMYDMSIDMTLT